MENRRGNDIFLGVVGVATLLVAIIGATFAYFSASAQSNNDAMNTSSAELSLGFSDDPSKLSTNLIPATETIALYAGANQDWIAGNTITYTDGDGKTQTTKGKGLCKDENNNEVCGVYTFHIGNPNFSTAMGIQASLVSTINEFSNIWFQLYDENNNKVGTAKQFPQVGADAIDLGLDQQLSGSAADTANPSFDPEDPTTYTRVDATGATIGSDVKIAANRRTYKMVIFVKEINDDQTKVDSGKVLTAAIKIQTTSGKGVTGVIAAANSTQPAVTP